MTEALRAKAWDLALLLFLFGVTLALLSRGARGEQTLVFQLGPNDHGYVQGFVPRYEITNSVVGTRWTTYDGCIHLPLTLAGGPVDVSYRFSRIFGETAEVVVTLDDRTFDQFSARGGQVVTRTARIPVVPETPLTLWFRIDSHERQNLGLKLDWVRFAVGPRSIVRFEDGSRWLPSLFSAFLYALFRWGGLARGVSFVLSLSWIGALATGLSSDVFALSHVLGQLIVPGALLSMGAAGILRRFPCGRWVIPIFVVGYFLRGGILFWPSTYYPDVTNARRYVETFRETGGSLAERGVATQERTNVGYPRTVGGKAYAFPYSPLYFAPFGLLSTPGAIEDAVRHGGLSAASLEVIPIFWIALAIFGARAAVFASFLWLFSPPVMSRLLLALHATVIGNFLDTLVVVTILVFILRPTGRHLAGVAGTTLASLLVYTSSLFSVSALFLFVAAVERRHAWKLTGILLACGTLTVTWLYWPFLIAFFTEILPAIVHGEGGRASRSDTASGPVVVALSRIPLFYGYLYPVLAAAGLWVARQNKDPRAYRVLVAYTLAVGLMVALRASGIGMFKDLKEILFAAPLVAILSGACLEALHRRRLWGRVAAIALTGWLVLFGLERYQTYLDIYASPVTTNQVRAPS